MVSVCLPSDAFLQHLPSYLGFSYFGRGMSLLGCSSKAQLLLLTLDEGYLLTAAVPDLQRGIAPLGPPVPAQPPLLRLLLPAAGPGLGREVASPGHPQEELPRVRGQWRPGGDTPCPRLGEARRSHLTPEARAGDLEEPPRARGQGRRPGGATRGAAQAQEGLEELSHVEGQEQQR